MSGISRTHRSFSRRSIAAIAAALLVLLFSSASAYSAPANVHPSVLQWSYAHPGEPVPVIAQGSGIDSLVASVEATGGRVERELGVIGAVEAKVPAENLTGLAGRASVAYLSLDAPVKSSGTIKVDTKSIATTYPFSVDANDPWSKSYTGYGVGVAVVDTGITQMADFGPGPRIAANVSINPAATSPSDGFGHGTHIAGIVGGYKIKGKYIGIAPESRLVNVKVGDDDGAATMGDLIAGLQWVYDNKDTYNIRVVNLSLHSTTAESYQTSPLDAAVEALWFRGIFVVVAAGNLGSQGDAVSYPPANDPFVMTVGAIDDAGTTSSGDDVPTPWSSAGVTQDGYAKPELSAPGRGIISTMDPGSLLYQMFPEKVVEPGYVSLSGTSMAAGVVSGLGALVLERHPDWAPGQLKCTLIATARQLSSFYSSVKVPRAGNASNQSQPSCDSNQGIAASYAFAPMFKVGAVAWVLAQPNPDAAAAAIGIDPAAAGIQGATISSVDWSAIKWDAIKWDAIKWDAIKWDAIKWDAIKWDAITWSAVTPDGVDFSAITWSAIKWDAIKWDAIKWDAIKWSAIKWDAIKWDAIKWDAIKWDLVTD